MTGATCERPPVRHQEDRLPMQPQFTTKRLLRECEWRDIPGFPGYQVTRNGIVRGRSGRLMRPTVSSSGHLYALIRLKGRASQPRKLWLHRAVLLAFFGPCPRGFEARHLDGDRSNNGLPNLIWGSRHHQRQDDRRNSVQRGRPQMLTEQTAAEIRQLNGTVSSRSAGRRFGVSHTVVLRIWRGKIWARRK